MFKVKTKDGKIFETKEESILQVLQRQGVYLHASCGGKGSCGRCKIKVLEGNIKTESFFGISEKEKAEGFVLACQSFPGGDILIEIPDKLITVSERISTVKIEIIETILKEEEILRAKALRMTSSLSFRGGQYPEESLFAPVVKKLSLKIDPPSFDSHGDFERLKRSIQKELFISRKLAEKLSDFLRENNWSINLAITEEEILDFLSKKIYGIAVDIGTTTVVLALVDLEEGKIVDVASCYNSQINYGDDVITRIIFAEENPEGLNILRKSIVDDINALINTVSLRNKEGKIYCAFVAGNTTMCHIFWGINPKYIRQEPYTPTLNRYPIWKASDCMLLLEPQIPIYTLPSVAGYVGGDIVSGLLTTGLYKDEETSLFIDIGTNGEIVIGNKDFLITASTSAGPCFEGSGISCGMRATEGAVESFSYNQKTDEFDIKVIGNEAPRGICGSGMIDILSELFSKKVIDQKGKFVTDNSKHIKIFDNEARFVISSDCYITQSDIDNIIRAKAAIYAGISTLLEEVGLSERELKKVYIAGGFGEFLNIKKAIKIGMLPNLSEERFIFLGNTSLTGAVLCLLSKNFWELANELAQKMTYIDLSRSKKFMDEYVSALFLPHTDWERFRELG
ncbi:MAG: ASKHA domain-containing protein [Thermodesulfovibrio sp.]|nr:ASKHA domain-containing protein [Thermodesulfovibrio sp.]